MKKLIEFLELIWGLAQLVCEACMLKQGAPYIPEKFPYITALHNALTNSESGNPEEEL
jgi:hypothetical protein